MTFSDPTFTPVPQLPDILFPPNGDIVLGTILSDPKDVRRALSSTPVVTIEPRLKITRNAVPRPWKWTSNGKTSANAGIWAKLSGLPLIGGLGGSGSKADAVYIASENVTTEFFSPDVDYLKAVTETMKVRELTKKRGKPPVYMVVSLMYAQTATFQQYQGKSIKAQAELGLDAAAGGVPGAVGGNIGGQKDRASAKETIAKEPFVLAYQLIEIRVRRDGTVKDVNYNKNDLFDDSNKEQKALNEAFEITIVEPEQVWSSG